MDEKEAPSSLSEQTNDWLKTKAEGECKNLFGEEWGTMFSGHQEAFIDIWVDGYKAFPQLIRMPDNPVFTISTYLSREDTESFARMLSEFGINNALVVWLAEGQKIEHLDEDQMKNRGWIRDPQFIN